jgi:hypothetical protein
MAAITITSALSLAARVSASQQHGQQRGRVKTIFGSKMSDKKKMGERKERSASLTVRAGGKLNTDKSYNCVVTQDGVIIANDIPSGVYEVSAWWGGGVHEDSPNPQLKRRLVPRWLPTATLFFQRSSVN